MARILVIDDEPQIRSLLRQMLEREGHDVEDAADGKAGLQLFREHPADLVITDILMPEKEGLETIRELRRDFPDTPAIAISGGGTFDPDLCLNLASKLGASEVIQKPFLKRELLEAVRRTLEEREGAS